MSAAGRVLTTAALLASLSGCDLKSDVAGNVDGSKEAASAGFQITGPASPVLTVEPQVSWQKLAGAVTYDLIIDDAAACEAPFLQSYTDLTTAYQKLGALGDGTYYACVTATDDFGAATPAANQGFAFTVKAEKAPPVTPDMSGIEAFSITAPPRVLGAVAPTVAWEAAGGAVAYDLVVASDAGCQTPLAALTGLTVTAQTLPAPLPAAAYYVCVTAKGNAPEKARAATNNGYGFTVDATPPGPFAITGPISPAEVATPQVAWQASDGAATYDLVIDNEATCAAPHVQSYGAITATSQTLSALAAGVYFACLTATDAAGNVAAATNSGYSFAVDLGDTSGPSTNPLGTFAITAPTAATAVTTPTVKWAVCSGAATYDLVVASDASCATPVASAPGLATTSYTLGAALTVGQTYYACVTAHDGLGFARGASNNGQSFAIDQTPPAAFSIIGPASPIANAMPQVSWDEAADAVRYRVVVDTDSGCTAPVAQKYDGLTTTSQALSFLSDGTYYVCVDAYDAAGNVRAASNTAYSFVVNTATAVTPPNPLGAFSLTGPGAITGDTTPDVTWQPSATATKYDVTIASDADCNTVVASYANVAATTKNVATVLSDGTTYYVCVTAKDNGTGTRAASNNGLSFTVDTSPPATFAIVGPASPATTATPQVSWQAAAGAASYKLIVDSDAGCGAPHLQVYDNLTSTSQALSALGDGTYYACVTARDAAANLRAASNDGYSFAVSVPGNASNPLGAFSVTGPAVTTSNLTPTLTWQASAAATRYDVVIASDAACATAVVSFSNVAATSKQITPALTANTTYFACVTAKDAGANTRGAANNGFAFATDTAPPAAFSIVGPVSPSNTATPQVSWQTAAGATSYDLIVDDAATCTAPYVQSFTGVTGTSQALTALGDGTYYVCVTARDAAGNSQAATNDAYSFTVTTTSGGGGGGSNPLGAFALTGPASPTNVTTPTITWQPSASATKYDLAVATDPACGSTVETYSNYVGTSKTLVTTLTNGTTYYVCLTAKDNGANTRAASNSGSYSFTIDTTAPAVFSISGPASPTNSPAPQVSWGASTGAATYDVIVDSEGSCSAPYVQSYQGVTSISQALSPLGDGTYYVCVTARDAAGNTRVATNNAYSFTVDTSTPAGSSSPLGPFNITGPASPVGTALPTITWGTSSGATKYDVVVATNASCSTVVESASNVAGTNYTMTVSLSNGATYYLCVTAKDNGANTRVASNNTLSVTVDLTAPGAFSISGPVSPYNSATPQVSWSAATGAASYTVLVDTEATCAAPNVQTFQTSSTSQSLAALGQGQYYLCVVARSAAGLTTNASNNGYSLVIDLLAPSTPLAPSSATGSTAYPNTLQFTWTDPGDNGPTTVASYNLKVGTAPGLGNFYTGNVGNVLTKTLTSAVVSSTYYAVVQAVDEAGNLSPWSQASSGVTIQAVDVTPPPALTAFTGTTPTKKHRSITLLIDFPADTSDYRRLEIRRAAGATAPATTCNTDTLVATLTNFTDVTLYDDIGATGTYSYRACAFDAAGNYSSSTATSVVASDLDHTMFTTNALFDGNLAATYQSHTFGSGLEGGDYRCQYLADQVAGYVGFSWKAFLSDSGVDAKDRIVVWKPIRNSAGTLAANNLADLLDNTVAAALGYNESGTSLGSVSAWTGSTAAGVKNTYHCSDWSTTTGNGNIGRVDTVSGGTYLWNSNNNCSTVTHLYCIAQPPPLITQVTQTAVSGTLVHFGFTFNLNHSHARYGSVTIRQLSGSTPPKADCSNGTVVKTLSPPFTNQTIPYNPGVGTFSYRVCAYDTTPVLAESWVPIAGTPPPTTARRIFVSSESYNGFLGGIALADAKCQYLADQANIGSTWQALLSTATDEARSRLYLPGPVLNMVGLQVAASAADLWDGSLADSVAYDQLSQPVTGCPNVWTGTSSLGTLSGYGCFDGSNTAWMSSAANGAGTVGSACSYSQWLSSSTQSCSQAARLYCLEQYGVPTLPSTDRRMFISSETYTGFLGGIASADAKCQYLADNATGGALGGTWKAVLSTETVDVRNRISIPGAVYNMNGQMLATNANTFWGATTLTNNNTGYDQNGASVGGCAANKVWTGSVGGVVSSQTCVDGSNVAWKNGASGNGTAGYACTGGGDWQSGLTQVCTAAAHLYCIEQ